MPTWAVVSSSLVTVGVWVRRERAGLQAAASTNTRRTRLPIMVFALQAAKRFWELLKSTQTHQRFLVPAVRCTGVL